MCIKISDFNGYTDFAEAVVRQAVADYKAIKEGKIEESKYVNRKEIEKFFRSKWGNALCYGHGEDVLRILKKEIGGEDI